MRRIRAPLAAYSKWTPPSSDETTSSSRETQDLSAYDISTSIRKRARDFELVETSGRLKDMVKALSTTGCMAIDCEGVDLGQPGGQLSLIQIAARKPSSTSLSIYVVDVTLLDWRAFHHRLDPSDPSSPSLKTLLESQEVTKLIFDARSDASALLRHFNVKLRGSYDLQVTLNLTHLERHPSSSFFRIAIDTERSRHFTP